MAAYLFTLYVNIEILICMTQWTNPFHKNTDVLIKEHQEPSEEEIRGANFIDIKTRFVSTFSLDEDQNVCHKYIESSEKSTLTM